MQINYTCACTMTNKASAAIYKYRFTVGFCSCSGFFLGT